jgi:cytochrome c biogenesis protein CcmG/thiol:disulfide interchange protein DsbE
MTTPIRNRFVAALAASALLALTACGGSDAASDAALPSAAETADTATEAGEAAAETAATEPAVAAGAILENSESLTVTGEALPPLEDPDNDAAVGMASPVVIGATFDGTEVSIGGPTDGPTMLVFLAHWCPHCNDEIPEIVTLRDRGDLPDNLNIIGVSTAVQDDRDNFPPSSWIVEKDWTWPVLADTADSEAIQLYGGTGFPFTVMLNADGTVNARKSGSESADQILEWINAALFTV